MKKTKLTPEMAGKMTTAEWLEACASGQYEFPTMLEMHEHARASRTPAEQAAIEDLHAGLAALETGCELEEDLAARQRAAETSPIFIAVP